MSFTQVIESTSNEQEDVIQLKHRAHPNADINSIERSIKESDPLALQHKKMSEKYIHDLKQKNGGRKLQKFYRNQNELINNMLTALDPEDEEEKEKQLLKLKIAIYGSVVANIILFALQLVAAITSGSLSIFSTMADAFMDLLSSGKSRMETVGIIIFACLMSCVALFLIIEAAQKLGEGGNTPDLSALAIAFVAAALSVKLVLYIYCQTLSSYSSAKVLAQDHRNDLLVNSLGLATGIVGSRVAGWVDAVGSIVIALIILRSWVSTLFENIPLVVGKSADTQFLNLVTYIALTHPGVVQVDTCRAYYAGNNVFVEVDIVLPPTMQLRDSHDIGEDLQIKLESLPDVERAFVHVDYETEHKPEHQKTK
ncbi:hypothetical protein K501DRAFT_297599 [Backusella circina FSU 941]|nr:hypothetical protein K501DRAFT_297599 [Backusella circina FSU 941]